MRAPSQQPTTVGPVDVEAFSRNLARIIEEGGRALAAYMKPREDGRNGEMADELRDVVKTLGEVLQYWMADPHRTAELQSRLGRSYLDLWGTAVRRLSGEAAPAVVTPAANDKRFSDSEWSTNQFYDFLKQLYLLTVDWANRLVSDADKLDRHTRHKAEFYIRQIANALSPSNFVLTNPELLRETLTSNAENLVRGMHMLAEDVEAGGGHLKIRQSDTSMFAVGRNLATTPGKVIYQNDIMQLLQYAPSTEKVLKRPLLIVPPWINKYYVLDLTPEKSFIKWCVDQGITVFCVSWVNPDGRLARKTFEDYIREGPLAALDAIKQATGEERSTPSAIASAAPCCRWRWQKWRRTATIASRRRPCSPLKWISPTPATSRSSSTRHRSRPSSSGWRSAAISRAARWSPSSTSCARTT